MDRLKPLRALPLLLFAAAQAQTAPDAANPTAPAQGLTALPKVEISASRDQYDPRRFDTAAKIVVTQEEIAKFGDTTLADVLKRQPGITVNGGSAGRGGGEVRMRGLGAGYTQILLNGEAAPPGFTLDSLSPSLIERIEIVRAASAEFSTQGIAGTINIVLKSKVVKAQREFKATLEGSSGFQSASVNLQASDKLDGMSYTVAGNLRSGVFNGYSSQVDDGSDARGQGTLLRQATQHSEGRFSGLALTPRLNWTLPGGDTLTSQTFLNLNRWQSNDAANWTAQLGPLPAYPIDRAQAKGSSDRIRTDLNWVRKLESGGKLDAKLGLNASQRDTDWPEQGYDPTGLQTRDALTLSTAHDQGATLVGKYSTPFADNHTLASGWDAGSTRRSETRVERDRPIPGQLSGDSEQIFRATLNRLALYAQDEWSITPKWSVYLGLRWETLDTRIQGNHFDAIHNRSSVLSPLFQTLWKLPDSKDDQVRLALTRSYKAPGIASLIPIGHSSANNSSVAPDFQGNPSLKPELATGIDLAYEHFLGDGASMSASLYRRQIGDFTRTQVSLVGERWISMPINDGRAQTRGLELEAKFALQHFEKSAPAIDVRANLTRNFSSVEQVPGPNNRLADQTPLSANFGLDYKMQASFNLGGNFTYKSGGPIRLSASSSTLSSIKREMDLYALWKFDAKYQLRLSASNVLAQPYSSVAQYVDGNGSLRSSSLYPSSLILRAALELKL